MLQIGLIIWRDVTHPYQENAMLHDMTIFPNVRLFFLILIAINASPKNVFDQFLNETALGPHVYQKGPPIGMGWVMQGWGGSYRGRVGHTGVLWVM